MSSFHRSLYSHRPPFLLRRRASFPLSPELKHHFIPPSPSSSSSRYYSYYEEDEPQSPIDQNPFRFFVSPPTPPDEMQLDHIKIENDDDGDDDLSAGIEGAAPSTRRGAYFDMPRQPHDIGSGTTNRDSATRTNKRAAGKHVSFLLGPDEDPLPPSSATTTADAINATYTDIIAFPPRPPSAERGRSRRRLVDGGAGGRRCRTHSDRRRSWVRPDWRLGMISESEEEEGDTEEEEGGEDSGGLEGGC
ncbi:MAG: hypothetical protein M1824_001816 [Vezdaea acicularis]|nr:MAG: hypothetical protein M1824_001816 [Vezdaea acicularis]